MISPSLTDEEHQRLADQIRRAEMSTRGEIYCVIARSSDTYFFPAAFTLTLGMLLASLVVTFWLDRSWLAISHLSFVLIQIAAIAAALLLAHFDPALRIRMVPRRLAYRRAHDNALKQFLAHNVHTTERRTGILIFVSLAERYAAVIADSGINAIVEQEQWNEIVARLTKAAKAGHLVDGLAEAVDRAGGLLTAHFPGGSNNPNELDDHVVEI